MSKFEIEVMPTGSAIVQTDTSCHKYDKLSSAIDDVMLIRSGSNPALWDDSDEANRFEMMADAENHYYDETTLDSLLVSFGVCDA